MTEFVAGELLPELPLPELPLPELPLPELPLPELPLPELPEPEPPPDPATGPLAVAVCELDILAFPPHPKSRRETQNDKRAIAPQAHSRCPLFTRIPFFVCTIAGPSSGGLPALLYEGWSELGAIGPELGQPLRLHVQRLSGREPESTELLPGNAARRKSRTGAFASGAAAYFTATEVLNARAKQELLILIIS